MVAILTQSKELLAEINRELPDGLLPDEWQQLRQEVRQALARGGFLWALGVLRWVKKWVHDMIRWM